MTAPQQDTLTLNESTPKNPYNTRRRSLYFSPITHSASIVDSTSPTTTPVKTIKHPAQHPEQNPRSPKRVRRLVHVDGSLTPPPSPPTVITDTPAADIDATGYDEEDDIIINAVVHLLQLSDNKPVSTRGLASSILRNRLCSLPALNPSNVINNRITAHIKRRAAEKPPREPILTRLEYKDGRKRTEYYLKYPSLLSDRSTIFAAVKSDGVERPQSLTMDINVQYDMLNDIGVYDTDDDDATNRSPDRPTLFDPPLGITLSPNNDPLLTTSMSVEVDVLTEFKLDYEFYDDAIPSVPLENLTPPREEISSPNTPFTSCHSSVHEVDTEPPSPPADEDPDDPQSPLSGGPDQQSILSPSLYDSPLIYHSAGAQTEQAEIFAMDEEEHEDDEVHVIGACSSPQRKRSSGLWSEDFAWQERRGGAFPSPEKTGMEELEEWLEGI